ncbi:hypothetical protein IQ07DRAFT_343153 [Pyrenochaeta sp. DS3sAY3a]|nr:hypothetical protein IQ07DRAFT_343153 [Pyrenochaeta sp. DS3sAY3a]
MSIQQQRPTVFEKRTISTRVHIRFLSVFIECLPVFSKFGLASSRHMYTYSRLDPPILQVSHHSMPYAVSGPIQAHTPRPTKLAQTGYDASTATGPQRFTSSRQWLASVPHWLCSSQLVFPFALRRDG